MNEFVVVVDGVVRFLGTFAEASQQAQALRLDGARPVVRRARPGEQAAHDDAGTRWTTWVDDDPDVIPF